MKEYVNWHAHSHGSLLDGVSRPEEYAARAKELNQPCITFTDHGNIHSLLDARDAAESVGVKFMPGIELYQARKTRLDRDEEERSGRTTNEWEQRGPYHLGIIAYNNIGYKNLIKLSSKAYTEGYFVKPRADHGLIEEHSEGLIVMSGCLSSEVNQAFLRGDDEFAYKSARRMQDIVGRENYFIEVQRHGIPEEEENYPKLIKLAEYLGSPIVATCDCHYTHKHDADHHDISLCINTGAKRHDENRFKFSGDSFYLKSYDEMASLFPEEYLDNTLLIYDKFDLDISYGEYHFPIFEVPNDMTEEEFFVHSVYEGAYKRFGPDWRNNQIIEERIQYELNVIRQLGYANYFLIVSDIVKWAKDNNVMSGPGRGSAAGCIVAYCLFITEVDPIKYDLAFERFLVYQPPVYSCEFPELV